MAKVKLNLRSLSTTEKVAKARQILAALSENSDFPTPQPPLAQVIVAADRLDTAYTNVQTAKQALSTKFSILNEEERHLESILRQLAAYIESISGDDETKILSAGLQVRSVATSPSANAPTGLTTKAGNHDGEIDLSWSKVRYAKSYIIERSADPPSATSWVYETVSLRSSAIIRGLSSGTRYWFRVAAVLSSGTSGWSDPATRIAP